MVGTTSKSMAATFGAWLCKRSPSLSRRPPWFDHVLGDARLCDLKPEPEQFSANAWRTAKRIFDARLPDQDAQLGVDLRSPSP
jgi:hypothetical protein